jgi:hypothetical protein
MFVGGLAGVGLRREHLILEAIAAERMPHRLVVSGIERAPFFELRDYGANAARVGEILRRHGVVAVLEENGRLLFPFESLAARERTWRELSADFESHALREIAVYRSL